MATEIPFTAEASLTYPPDDGLPAVTRSAAYSGVHKVLEEKRYDLVGSGTKVVDLAAIPAAGAKAVMVEVDASSDPAAAPVMVTLNDGTEPVELAPGGFLVISNPKPVASITAISLAHTTASTVRVRVLG